MTDGAISPPHPLYPVIRLAAALLLMTIGGVGMWATVVALKPIGAEFGVNRGAASLPYTLYMIGFGTGGVVMGRLADRFGVFRPLLLASVALPAGFVLSTQATELWQFCLIQGVLVAFLGASTTFAPLVADTSHWFYGRRGLAVGIVISGSYVAGTVWPPVMQHFFDLYDWRTTFVGVGVLAAATMLPLTFLFRRRPLIDDRPLNLGAGRDPGRPLGFRPNVLQGLICCAGIGCCVAMSMPQVHIVAYATDLGHAAQRGAELLSVMLGGGVISRMLSGWISDRIGGLRTMLLGSALQALSLVLFLGADTLVMLYVVSAIFGLSQGGIVPSYAIIVRTFFPASQAGWRIGLSIMFTIFGMAFGGWMAGALYDLTGAYVVSFLNGIAFNVLNLMIGLTLLYRAGRPGHPVPAAA